MIAGFIARNIAFAASNVRKLPEVRRAMREVDSERPCCAWCGRKGDTDIHHCIPVSVDPSRAADKANMIPLCRKKGCHFAVGHFGDWKDFNQYVESTCLNYGRAGDESTNKSD